MIGLEDIAGIKSAEEGKAVALAIYNQLQEAEAEEKWWVDDRRRNVLKRRIGETSAAINAVLTTFDPDGNPVDPDAVVSKRLGEAIDRYRTELDELEMKYLGDRT